MIKTRGTQTNARNDFDLKNRHAYTQKAGVITPVKAIHVLPDDFHHLNIGDFTQTFPMVSAPFLDGKKELSAYFVPFNTLWHNFNQYQATREDPQSSLLKIKGITNEPRISLYDLYAYAFYLFTQYVMIEYGLFASYVNDGSVSPTDGRASATWLRIVENQKNISLHVGAATTIDLYVGNLHSAYADVIGKLSLVRDDDSLNLRAPSGNFYLKDVICNVVGNYVWCDVLRKYDMLGYGNLWPAFKECLNTFDEELDKYLATDPYELNVFYTNTATALLRLLRRLKNMCSGTELTFDSNNQIFYGTHTYYNAYPLFAYNKIFYDYFRNTYYDDNYDVRCYNMDFVDCSSPQSSRILIGDLPARFFMLEMHQYKKDMFTGIMPSTQFGAVSVLSMDVQLSGDTENNGFYLLPNGSPASTGTGYLGLNNGILTNFSSSAQPNITHVHSLENGTGRTSLNPLDLKRVEALQQFRQDLLRAGNRTEDIFKQIYGAEPKSQLSEKPYFIDAVSNPINVNPVIATANTGTENNGQLGDIASRGMISGKNIDAKFSSNDFGVIIVLSYVVPEVMYNSTRIDPHLANLSPEEHFIPHFMNLGFEPLYRMFLSNYHNAEARNNSVGFALPYLEFKTDIDLAHGAFAEMLSSDVTPRPGGSDNVLLNFRGSLAQWVVVRSDMQQELTTTLRNFYINPSVLDTIFVQESGDDYETDQFISYTSISDDCVRQMSELGLPNFL